MTDNEALIIQDLIREIKLRIDNIPKPLNTSLKHS
jgi:hypothetical protein